MNNSKKWRDILLRVLSYVLVAAVASVTTLILCLSPVGLGQSKLDQLERLLLTCFVDGADKKELEDGAAAGMIAALGDRWSYYIPADQYASYVEQKENAYVGIGVTIRNTEDDSGFLILKVEEKGPAKEAGVQAGDILTHVEGQSVEELGVDDAKAKIVGKSGTKVTVTLLRDGQSMDLSITRKRIQAQVASGQLLENNVGLVTIHNFNDRCAAETITQIEDLIRQGATSLVFDVRNNPGGYKNELVKLLDYLLPKGPLFRSRDYTGRTSVDQSDAKCLEMPMAVLVNEDSYSAAEFFAAALQEYDWAIVGGVQTSGKGHFQNTYVLQDGSAVALSVGRYTTPNDVDLEGVGITPDVPQAVDKETAAKIYAGTLAPEEDPQLQAVIQALLEK